MSAWPPVLDNPYNIHIAKTLTNAFTETDLHIAKKFQATKKARFGQS